MNPNPLNFNIFKIIDDNVTEALTDLRAEREILLKRLSDVDDAITKFKILADARERINEIDKS